MSDVRTLAELQAHTNERKLALPRQARDLRTELIKILVKAHRARRIKTSPEEIQRRITLMDEQVIAQQLGAVFKDLKSKDLSEGAFCIVGGVKNQKRSKNLPHFERDDGAWFDFSITVRETAQRLELLAYDFEIRFQAGMGSPFLRFDLNLPDHRNQDRDLRCHQHPGVDDLLVPAPLMTPSEMLHLFVEVLRLPVDRKPRARTEYERRWFKESFEQVPSTGAE